MTFWKWSQTAASNATADSTINWAEGQPPSSVNDSARAMMAAAAKYRDDISGSLATGGTSSAYTLTTNQGIPSPPTTGQLIAFTPHVTNGVNPTLVTDSGGSYQIWDSSGGIAPAGTLIAGTPYTAKFDGSYWRLRDNYGNPYNIPVAGYLDMATTSVPNSSFAICYGQALSRTTYATLFSLISTIYGAGDGSTTFNLPDFRGRVAAGVDNMGGTAANRLVGFAGFAGGGAQTHSLTAAELPNLTLGLTGTPAVITVTSTQSQVYQGSALQSASTQGGATYTNNYIGAGGGVGPIVSQGNYTPAGTIYNGGANVPFDNTQPFFTVIKMIRVI